MLGQHLLHTNFIPSKVYPLMFPGLVSSLPSFPASTSRGLCGCNQTGTRNHSSKLSVYLLKMSISSEAAGL